jgi:adenosylmethionine-8-amino-7-oxononanoate aminotransferase
MPRYVDATAPDVRYFTRNPRGKYLSIARADGVYLYDTSGRAILDGSSGAAVVCLGHGHRRLIERLKTQAECVAFAHTSTFVTEPVLEFAERLASYTADPGARVYLVSGGSEATETALKIARTYHLSIGQPARHVVVSRSLSYHGATMGALSMAGMVQRRRPFEPLLAQFPRISTCYCYRCPVGRDPELCDVECADDLERTILAHDPQRIAAFIMEPVIGSSAPGVTPSRDYMGRVAATCRGHGVLLIADEVMSGVGRTGRFFAAQHYGVMPDIIALSKGLSSGYFPLGAVVVSGRVFEAISNGGSRDLVHGFTYAGNPVGAAVGLEVLTILEQEHLVPRVASLGERLLAQLQSLRQLPLVGDIRGKGLLLGIELVMDQATRQPFPASTRAAQLVQEACLQEDLYVYPTTGSVNGVAGDNILIAPPYVITEPQLDELVDKLSRGLHRAQQHLFELMTSSGPATTARPERP